MKKKRDDLISAEMQPSALKQKQYYITCLITITQKGNI